MKTKTKFSLSLLLLTLPFLALPAHGRYESYGNAASSLDTFGPTISEARVALADLASTSGDEFMYFQMQRALTDPVVLNDQFDQPGWLSMGPWNINLEQRRFNISTNSTVIFIDIGGPFRRKDGIWRAEIDHHARCCAH